MNTTWYFAELLQEWRTAHTNMSRLQNNIIIVEAVDAENAYTKSLAFGEQLNSDSYDTSSSKFRGLHALNEIYDEFIHGAELIFEIREEINDAEIERYITPKDKLAAFSKKQTALQQTSEQKWFIAQLLQEFRAIDAETSLLWINWILIQATDAEDAYTKSIAFGQEYNQDDGGTFTSDGIPVIVRFQGLRDLHEILEDLADGSTLIHEEFGILDENKIREKIRPKERLSVFQPRDAMPNE
ncbi:MAG: DUF4288 domain-containing protein [Aggregatilineales bacterium]